MADPFSHGRVIPFPTRSTVSPQPNINAELLAAAKAAERAITLALGDKANSNTIIRKLRTAIGNAELKPEPPKTPSPAAKQARCESITLS